MATATVKKKKPTKKAAPKKKPVKKASPKKKPAKKKAKVAVKNPRPIPSPGPNAWTPEELAVKEGVHIKTMMRWIRKGMVKADHHVPKGKVRGRWTVPKKTYKRPITDKVG